MNKIKQWAQKLNHKISAVFIAVHRNDTPLYAKIACLMCIWYALSPVDLIPDFIPLLGYLDDIIVLPCLIWLCVKLIPTDIMEECEIEAQQINSQHKEKNWLYALPIIAVWILLAIWLVGLFIK